MADNQTPEELVFHVPAADFKYTHGCSIDYGGSIIKLAYTLSEEEQISVHCLSFPANNLEGALHYLKLHAPKSLEPGSTINVCGVGCATHAELIKKTLGVELSIMNEFDGFVGSFRYLFGVLPRKQLFYPESKVVTEYVSKQVLEVQKTIADMVKIGTDMDAWALAEEKKEEDGVTTKPLDAVKENADVIKPHESEAGEKQTKLEYPALLVMCGSGGCPISIKEDGTYQPLDGLMSCGRYFLGMGSLLTSAKRFEDMTTLAENGDAHKLDVAGRELKQGGRGDFYSAMVDDMTYYAMGHAVQKSLSDFRREDLAAALVANVAYSVAQTTHLWALIQDVKTVYFCGSLVSSSQIFRDAIGKELGFRGKINALGKRVDHHFLRCGAYLGCIGCMMMTLKQESVMSTSL